MEEILHHLGWRKPCKYLDKLPITWCRISGISWYYFEGYVLFREDFRWSLATHPNFVDAAATLLEEQNPWHDMFNWTNGIFTYMKTHQKSIIHVLYQSHGW